MALPFKTGFTQDSGTLSSEKVTDSSGTSRSVFDSDGYIYQRNTKLTATGAELNVLAGVTAGTIAASKAVVVDSSSAITGLTIDSSSNYLKNVVMAYAGTVTLAQLNAGITLVAGVSGRTIRVTRVTYKVNGAFNNGGGTSIIIQDTNSTPIVILTAAKTALTDGALISNEDVITNVTIGAGSIGNLTLAKGIAIAADASLSTGTSINLVIEYMYV